MNRRLRASLEAGGAGPSLMLGLVEWSQWGAWPAGLSRLGRLTPSKNAARAELAEHGRLGIPGSLARGSERLLGCHPRSCRAVLCLFQPPASGRICSRHRSGNKQDLLMQTGNMA